MSETTKPSDWQEGDLLYAHYGDSDPQAIHILERVERRWKRSGTNERIASPENEPTAVEFSPLLHFIRIYDPDGSEAKRARHRSLDASYCEKITPELIKKKIAWLKKLLKEVT